MEMLMPPITSDLRLCVAMARQRTFVSLSLSSMASSRSRTAPDEPDGGGKLNGTLAGDLLPGLVVDLPRMRSRGWVTPPGHLPGTLLSGTTPCYAGTCHESCCTPGECRALGVHLET